MTQNPLLARVALTMGGKSRRLTSQDSSDSTVGLLGWHDNISEGRNDADSQNSKTEGNVSPRDSETVLSLSPASSSSPTNRRGASRGHKLSASHSGDFGASVGTKLRKQTSPTGRQQQHKRRSKRPSNSSDSNDKSFHDFDDFSSTRGNSGAWDFAPSSPKSTRSDVPTNDKTSFIIGPETDAEGTGFSFASSSRSEEFKSPSGRNIYKDGISRAFLAKQNAKASKTVTTARRKRQEPPVESMFFLPTAASDGHQRVQSPSSQSSRGLDDSGFFFSHDGIVGLPDDNGNIQSSIFEEGSFSGNHDAFTGGFAMSRPQASRREKANVTGSSSFGGSEGFSGGFSVQQPQYGKIPGAEQPSVNVRVDEGVHDVPPPPPPPIASPPRRVNSSATVTSHATASMDDLLAIKRELSDLKLWAKKKKVRGKKVQFSHPLITTTNYRPRTEPEDIDKLFFNENELLDWEEDLITTSQEHVECTIEQNNMDVQVEVALLP